MPDYDIDPDLRPYATERQWELIEAWAVHGSSRKAAAALGVSHKLVDQAKSAVLKKAARAGYSPGTVFHNDGRVPEGFVLKGQSALVDKDGKLRERWDKTKQAGLEPEDARTLPDPKKTVKLSTMTDADGKVIVQWVSEKPEDVARERAWLAFAKALQVDIPPVDPVPPPYAGRDDLLAVYPVGDHHMGMLSWEQETGADYDLKIGEELLIGAFSSLLNATQGACNPAHAMIPFLGDLFHYDSFESVTPTSRNQLDSDSRYPKMVSTVTRAVRHMIGLALEQHQTVRIVIEIGNHDLSSSIFLAECMAMLYMNEPRVTVDTSPKHFHYYRFGKVLLGTHHGHGTKMQNLPLIMATDRPADWGATEFRYMYTGHTHTSVTQAATNARDYSGCVVESFRILPPSDAWAHQKGYRPHRDMTAIIHNRNYGEVSRFKVNPAMLEGGYE